MVATRVAFDGGIQVATDTYGGEFDPAVVPAPASLAGERVIKAFCIDSVTVDGTSFTPVIRSEVAPYCRHRVRIGGKDVSFFRGVQTPMPSFGLVEPLLFWSGTLTLPQVHAALERPGHGDLTWLRKWAPVVIDRVDADDNVVATDWRGFIADYQHDGRSLTCTLAGQATGTADLQDRAEVLFPDMVDIGTQAMNCVRRNLGLSTGDAPTTGIVFPESGGTGSQLDFLHDLLARSTTLGGSQWTIMPDAKGIYQMFRKDVTTIDATVYIDGSFVSESLRRDFTQEPTRVWGTAVTPDGMRVRNAKFPGYGGPSVAFPGTLSPGDSGDGVLALKWQLFIGTYLDDPSGSWTTDADDPITEAVKELQADAGLSQTGVVNAATWKAAYNTAIIGGGLRGAHIEPMAADTRTVAYLRNAVGQVIGQNPLYDKGVKRADLSVDMGPVKSPEQARKYARQKLAPATNWNGTITVNTGAVIDGEHNTGDPLTADLVRDSRSVKPGHNLWVPNWDGGTLFHVSGCDVQYGSVTFAVDTQARDAMEVWAIRERNRESRANASRSKSGLRRRSAIRDDTGAFYDGGVFGKIPRTFCPAGTWTVIETPAGRSGTFQKIDIQTDDPAAFMWNLWGSNRQADWLNRHLGDPFDDGFADLMDAHQDGWADNYALIDHWGTKKQPCGYGSRKHTKDDGTISDAPITGRFVYRPGSTYYTRQGGLLRLGFYPDRDTWVQGGRVLYLLLDDAAS